MKTRKLSFEDFKENQLEKKQIINILGSGGPNLEEYIVLIGPTGGGGTGNGDTGAGIANPKP
jgi:hypothetical protein